MVPLLLNTVDTLAEKVAGSEDAGVKGEATAAAVDVGGAHFAWG